MKQGYVLRVARPTSNLTKLAGMYVQGLGFRVLGQFADHEGFDGIILGQPGQAYHLEFTTQKASLNMHAPSPEQLLVFYIPDKVEWNTVCQQLLKAGFKNVRSNNPYWDFHGKTFTDIDGCRVVLQQSVWEK